MARTMLFVLRMCCCHLKIFNKEHDILYFLLEHFFLPFSARINSAHRRKLMINRYEFIFNNEFCRQVIFVNIDRHIFTLLKPYISMRRRERENFLFSKASC